MPSAETVAKDTVTENLLWLSWERQCNIDCDNRFYKEELDLKIVYFQQRPLLIHGDDVMQPRGKYCGPIFALMTGAVLKSLNVVTNFILILPFRQETYL